MKFAVALASMIVSVGLLSSGQASALDPALPAEGWEQIEVLAPGSNIRIDRTGHFHSSWSVCHRETHGDLPLHEWNTLAGLSNMAVKSPLGAEACAQIPWKSNYWPRAILVKTSHGDVITLAETRDGNLCSTYFNPAWHMDYSVYIAFEGLVRNAIEDSCKDF